VHGDEIAGVLIKGVIEPAVVYQLLGLRGHVGRQYDGSAHLAGRRSIWFPWYGQDSTTYGIHGSSDNVTTTARDIATSTG